MRELAVFAQHKLWLREVCFVRFLPFKCLGAPFAYNVLTETYGMYKLINSTERTSRVWTKLSEITTADAGKKVLVRARIHTVRGTGKLAFAVIRDRIHAAQAVIAADDELGVSRDMVKWVQKGLTCESIVDVEAVVRTLDAPLTNETITQKDVELLVTKIFCVSRAPERLPVLLDDLSRGDHIEGSHVDFDTRLNNRILDLRTQANQAIFRVQHETVNLFREFLTKNGFTEIHSPKLIAGASEGGANCFTLDYFEQKACLAQSPQLYKQMALSGDLERVFEIGPVFRAENSNTNRHLCEFTGLDMEMTIKEHYLEVIELLDGMFRYIFEGLAERCKAEVAAVRRQYPGDDFLLSAETPKLDFTETLTNLRNSRPDLNIPEDLSEYDPSTDVEKALGAFIRSEYGSDFFMLLNYPSAVRPFYSMPHPENPALSNSYDFFMRGNEIVSGAQRIHDSDLLTESAIRKGIPPESLHDYIEAFRYGAYPHGGCGVGLERVVMLFLGLHSVKLTSLFPRDPKRLTP